MIARYSGAGDMYLAQVVNEGGGKVTAQLWKNVAGAGTQLVSQSGVSYGGSLKFVVAGSSLDLIIGATDLGVTDTSITTMGAVGIRSSQGRPSCSSTHIRRRLGPHRQRWIDSSAKSSLSERFFAAVP